MLEIRPFNSADQDAINAYQLSDAALAFTRTPEEALKQGEGLSGYLPFLVWDGDALVAFFVLDSGEAKYQYRKNKASLLFRSFSVDDRFLGKGYGKFVLQELPKVYALYFPEAQ